MPLAALTASPGAAVTPMGSRQLAVAALNPPPRERIPHEDIRVSPGKKVDAGWGKTANVHYGTSQEPRGTVRMESGAHGVWMGMRTGSKGVGRSWAPPVCARGFHLPNPGEVALMLLKERTLGLSDVNRFPQLHAVFGEPKQVSYCANERCTLREKLENVSYEKHGICAKSCVCIMDVPVLYLRGRSLN